MPLVKEKIAATAEKASFAMTALKKAPCSPA